MTDETTEAPPSMQIDEITASAFKHVWIAESLAAIKEAGDAAPDTLDTALRITALVATQAPEWFGAVCRSYVDYFRSVVEVPNDGGAFEEFLQAMANGLIAATMSLADALRTAHVDHQDCTEDECKHGGGTMIEVPPIALR